MPSFKGKTITDPLYGNIELHPIEAQIVSTPAFQRLHNVRQLGLGYLVFPSAGYSRFAHSIGAVVTTDRLISAINRNQDKKKFSKAERLAFRLAALIHDLGHFPFSHTTEHASKAHYSKSLTTERQLNLTGMDDGELGAVRSFIDHEDTGKLVFRTDPAIAEAFASQSEISQTDVEEAFLDPKLSHIVSSDLDCDRLDYLKRTAHHSGAPYGAVDVDFIISKATLDSEGKYCFDRKALRATDHLLVSRFYDFLQIPFHKTVAALEWSLEEAVKIMLRDGDIDLSEAGVFSSIGSGMWSSLDDAYLLEVIRNR